MKALKLMNQWLCWRYETKDGRRTKVPYGADGGPCGTDSKYKKRWVTFEESVLGRQRHGFDGAGLVIPLGYFGIDEDHMDIDTPAAKIIRGRIVTYEERSPSGTGQHLLAKCDISKIPQKDGKLDSRYYCKNQHNNLEIYFGGLTSRFFTFTGNVITGAEVTDCTEAALWFLDEYMLKEKFKKAKPRRQRSYDPIEAARRLKNGKKFIALYDNGDISGFSSQSEAELSLCNYLAFTIGDNPEEIDRRFRASKLYRDKWERSDYSGETIRKAIDGCDGNFHPGARELPPYLYYCPTTGAVEVQCALLARHIRENLRYIFVRDSAKGGVLRFIYEPGGVYRLYSDEMLKGVIKSFITSFDETILRMSDVNEVFQNIITDLVFEDSTVLNANENIINFQNGVLDLTAMELLPHSPDYLSTIQIPCDWLGVPTPTPVYDKFIADFTGGRRDVELLLDEFQGAVISNVKGWRMKKSLFLFGPGDTGKSQLRGLAERLVGKGNYIGIDLKELEGRFGTSNLYMKRMAGSADMSFASIGEVKVFKKATGGDSLFAEFKGQNGFEFIYDGLLWFCMNRLPKFGGDNGEWVYNRIMAVECANVIPKGKQDKTLPDKLYAEREGIVYRLVMALKQVISNGYVFDEPECVTAAGREYRRENSTVISFFNECMEPRPGGKISDGCTTGKVYRVYRAWCADNNNGFAKTAREFRAELAEHLGVDFRDITTRRGTGGTFYRDYTISAEVKKQYPGAYGYDDTEFLGK